MNSKFLKQIIKGMRILKEILISIGQIVIRVSLSFYSFIKENSPKIIQKIRVISSRLKKYILVISQDLWKVSKIYSSKLKKSLTKKRKSKLLDSLNGKLRKLLIFPTKSNKQTWVPQYEKVNKPKSLNKFLFGIKMFFLGTFFTIIFILIPSHVYLWLQDIPNPQLLAARKLPEPTRILDRNGRLLYEIYQDKRYEPIALNQIPQNMIDATIAVEDARFYTHHGFDTQSMLRAAKATFLEDDLQGGSTITQQLVKNVLLTPERTISRKLKELFLSVAVENQFTKKQILEMYLNNISYGGSAWGVQSAAQKFFGKNVWELDLAETSLLAGLPSAPSAYSPLSGDLSVAKERQHYVLERMVNLGYIGSAEAASAYNEELKFTPQTEYIRAPHFVAYVIKDLENKFGKRYVDQGGLTVKTTLDLDLQEKVQQIVHDGVERYSYLNISNGAAVVLDAKKAEILAYVGSVDYFKEGWGAFDVASAYRQPGSSIKPVTYSLAFENGLTPATTIRDQPVTFRIAGQSPYTPKNYDGKYHGIVTLRQALANSYNVPAVRLANMLGPDNIVALGRKFGLNNWQVDGSYGLAVTLGGKEVRLIDHTNLYATFARKGKYKDVTPYLSIKDRQGFEVYQDERQEVKVVKPETAYLIWNILSDNQARLPAFGVNNYMTIPGKTVAVKTGTTDQIRDNFTMGFTPSYAVGVWVGNNDNTPLNSHLASGLSGAAPIWNEIMTDVLADARDEQMPRPEGIFVKYDKDCNKSEFFIKGSKIPEHLCQVEKSDQEKTD